MLNVSLMCPPSRLVHSGNARGSPAQGSELVFATRTGTGRGIESHIFRVETHWDLSSWTRALVQGAHAAAELIKEVSIGECRCVCNRWLVCSKSKSSPECPVRHVQKVNGSFIRHFTTPVL